MERLSQGAVVVLERPREQIKPSYQELAAEANLAYGTYLRSHRANPGGDLGLEMQYVLKRERLLQHYPVRKNLGLPIPSYQY